PTPRAPSTATSSPPTCCSTSRASSGSPTSAWAKAADEADLTRTGDILGTLRYMAPERFRGVSEPRSDVYGLGMTLYELLTFGPAFVETDRERLIHQITQSEPARPIKLNPDVPRDLETIVLKAIDREPAHRYATAGELGEDLQRFLEDRPI